jgi:hypothetical protein
MALVLVLGEAAYGIWVRYSTVFRTHVYATDGARRSIGADFRTLLCAHVCTEFAQFRSGISTVSTRAAGWLIPPADCESVSVLNYEHTRLN